MHQTALYLHPSVDKHAHRTSEPTPRAHKASSAKKRSGKKATAPALQMIKAGGREKRRGGGGDGRRDQRRAYLEANQILASYTVSLSHTPAPQKKPSCLKDTPVRPKRRSLVSPLPAPTAENEKLNASPSPAKFDRQARFIGSSQGQSSYTPPSSSKQAQQSHNNSSFHSAPPSSDPHPRINTNVSGLYRPAHQRSPMAPIYSPSSSLDMQHHPPETQLVVGSITATRSATPQSRGDQPIAQNDHTTSYPYSQQGVATAYPESYEASYSNPGYYCEYP
ncbi:hypothetical protein FB45DRAFT_1034935 [Roridomyces roridus]|uniref:Uncharacterized protein n=1 Tax=Roridomyces roridus TaxID=1738132 RepID=A0AAD7FF32_9AGAR|nr:hypothetical protein FB45DRAFT_1034935 [Roridomyces roridus]